MKSNFSNIVPQPGKEYFLNQGKLSSQCWESSFLYGALGVIPVDIPFFNRPIM